MVCWESCDGSCRADSSLIFVLACGRRVASKSNSRPTYTAAAVPDCHLLAGQGFAPGVCVMPAEVGRSTAVDAHLAWRREDWRQPNLAPLVMERRAEACALISPVALILPAMKQQKCTKKTRDARWQVSALRRCGETTERAQTKAGDFFCPSNGKVPFADITCQAHSHCSHWLISTLFCYDLLCYSPHIFFILLL